MAVLRRSKPLDAFQQHSTLALIFQPDALAIGLYPRVAQSGVL
jgi:hypothetical protein